MLSLKPGILLVVYFLIALHGCPGLDYLGDRDFVSEKSRQNLRKQMPEAGAQVAIAFGALNRNVRLPFVHRTAWIQKPFRLAQTWNLYRDGPGRINRLEIRVDDQLIHRTADAELDWMSSQLRSRRIRPMVESTARSKNSKNWKGLARFVAAQARVDFPEAKVVILQSMQGRYPQGEMKPKHQIVVAAPDWVPVLK